jgi:ABC-type phosphate/phosphonate transport system ATPase subunit
MARITANRLVKRYGAFQAVHGIDFDIADGEFVAILGPSGCGKSSTMRMIAGLESVTERADSLFDGHARERCPRPRPQRRDVLRELCPLRADQRLRKYRLSAALGRGGSGRRSTVRCGRWPKRWS